ncbi:NAD-dependent malic enzyme [Thioalkalivibrio sp.]|uniref:NAD-dependent malic enzyme n=1 Tax=Thioalkalivibrio sp. TaxID=2093813 RepID=UPI0025E92C4B|nr:NAD-dependent malic enzyme [Thioalkalivibrio sp.]
MPQQLPGEALSGPLPEWFPRGMALLRDPSLNKGSAFTARERDVLGLTGLLPPHVSTQEEQVERVLENFRRIDSPLERFIMLQSLQDRNEALFYRVVIENPDEMMPVIYTPTVGLACQEYGHIYRSPRGLYVSAEDRGQVSSVLRNWPYRDARIIVVTDGERILGLGDLGASGMGIPIGKLALYTACAGVHPRRCLPVMFDIGTNNESLLEDPLYLGLRRRRLAGTEYDELMAEFLEATQEVFPGVVVQFEDFANHNAFRLLQTYRDRIPCFNDDIQGTAAVTLAGILSALRVTNRPLRDQTFLFLGAGEAATGIADLLTSALVAEGMEEGVARRRSWMVDSRGLVIRGRSALAEHKRPYAHEHPPLVSFLEAVEALRPTAIIGVGAVPGAFTREVIEMMAGLNDRPIVFALSNPTSRAECTAEQAYAWSDGRALFASGSPFDPLDVDGRRFVPRQGNNSYIFPGVGLGAVVSQASRVTDAMFMVAARALAEMVRDEDLAQGSLFPALARVREVSARIAVAVAEVAFAEGLAGNERPADLEAWVEAQMYDPEYVSYVA